MLRFWRNNEVTYRHSLRKTRFAKFRSSLPIYKFYTSIPLFYSLFRLSHGCRIWLLWYLMCSSQCRIIPFVSFRFAKCSKPFVQPESRVFDMIVCRRQSWRALKPQSKQYLLAKLCSFNFSATTNLQYGVVRWNKLMHFLCSVVYEWFQQTVYFTGRAKLAWIHFFQFISKRVDLR